MHLSTKLKFRRNVLPKNKQDFFFTSFAIIAIPLVYWFEIFIVLPHIYRDNPSVIWPIIHTVMGTFISVNIIGNLFALIFFDTSITGVILKSKSEWILCPICETMVPPRSWHCTECNVCILKRDHHCSFCSNCIGYFNQRYFIHFLIYVFIATLYASFYNFYFIYELSEFKSWKMWLNVIFPLAMLMFDYSIKQFYMFLSLIVLVMCAYSGVLLVFHVKLLLRGVVVHERKLGDVYNLGKIENIKEVFGNRWQISWISPLIQSTLSGDGQSFKSGRKNE
ncbi:probable palmitoyltransferase ZDHHC24 [Onthophagus taurus]|uniref:probable palmitoyltransferase ZDHHC24 n=1 Tax=Onthophagus taurus TaxID=166361 RepID=UPI000C20969F|nr:probable palmitoyltransferase ZDHHC24 [Onthophagus taurus]